MTQLRDLPEEIILEIISYLSDIHDCTNLLLTCRAFYNLNTMKIFWIAKARHAQRYRPVPLPNDLNQVSLESIRDLMTGSMRLGRMLQDKRMPQPTRISALIASAQDSAKDEKQVDPQIWVWLLEDGAHLMSMSKNGLLRLWNIARESIIVTFDVMGVPLCWDYTMDDKGITIIVNLEEKDNGSLETDTFRVWRHSWLNPPGKMIFSKKIHGDIRSNYIEGELTGCVGNLDDGPTFVYVLNWVTMEEAYIETPFWLPANLSAATSPKELFVYAEDAHHAIYYAYDLSHLSQHTAQPMYRGAVLPNIVQRCGFENDNVDAADVWVPTCRNLWDGRVGVFSRGIVNDEFQAGYIALSLLHLKPGAANYLPTMHLDLTKITRTSVFVVPEGGIVTSPMDWDICAMGTFAKTVVWMEYDQNPYTEEDEAPLQRIGRICFAEFPVAPTVSATEFVEDASVTKVKSTTATVDLDILDGMASDMDEETSAEHVGTASPLLEPDRSIEEGDIDTFQLVPDGQASLHEPATPPPMVFPPPVTFGHMCELPWQQEWTKEYGSIYTIDLDDARGRLAFSTSLGKIVIFDFL